MRKKRIFLISIFIFLLSFTYIPFAEGGSDGHSGSPGSGGGGSSGPWVGYNLHSAAGFRVTVVDKRTGERCKYNKDTNEVCTADTSGRIYTSKSIDMWFDVNVTGNPTGYNQLCWAVDDGKKTKQEFLTYIDRLNATQKSNLIKSCLTVYGQLSRGHDNISAYGFPTPADPNHEYPARWSSSMGSPEHDALNMTYIQRWLMCVQGEDKSYCEGRGGEGYPKNDIRTNIDFYSNLYSKLFGVSIDAGMLANIDNSYLQFEQLISVSYRNGGGVGAAYNTTSFGGVMGTVAEVAFIYKTLNKSFYWDEAAKRSHAWYANIASRAKFGDLNYIRSLDALRAKSTPSDFLQKDTANIMNFWVKQENLCKTSLLDALDNEKRARYNNLKTSHATDITTGFLAKYNYEEALFLYNNMTAAQKETLDCNTVLPCSTIAPIIYRKCSGGCNIAGVHYSYKEAMANYAAISQDSLKTAAAPSENESTNKSVWNKTWINAYRSTYGHLPTTCGIVTCDQNVVDKYFDTYKSTLSDSNYVNFMDWYYKATARDRNGPFAFLQTEVWQEMEREGPSCEGVPTCPGGNDQAPTCDSPSFYLADTAYGLNNETAQTCWQNGFAYTDGGLKTSKVKTLKNKCYLYCSEKVSFDLPTSPSEDVKAGQIFKWGKNSSDRTDNIFGSMTVERYCKVVGECKDANVSITSSEWKNQVHTRVELTYHDPSNKYVENGITLDSSYVDSTGSDADVTGRCKNNACSKLCHDADVTKCDNVTNFSNFHYTTNRYNLIYGDTLKWYSNKVDNSFVKSSGVEAANAAYYYEIGYGLPTSFVTPNGVYGGTATDAYAGQLTAKIESIGTNGHFDNLADFKSANSYSCQFKLVNELFGDECVYDATGALISGSPDYCDPNGGDGTPVGTPKNIDVVFRTVDLINNSVDINQGLDYAFPGRAGRIDGTSRSIGYNWWGRYEDLDDDAKKQNIATILNDQVYNVTNPQFTIELTTSKINDIRDFNENARSSGKDPFSELEKLLNEDSPGGGFTGYSCVEYGGTKFCASRFLTKLIADYGLRGRCVFGSTTADRATQHFSHLGDCS